MGEIGLNFKDMNTAELLTLLKVNVAERNESTDSVKSYLSDKNKSIKYTTDIVKDVSKKLFLMENLRTELEEMRNNAKELFNTLNFLFPEEKN